MSTISLGGQQFSYSVKKKIIGSISLRLKSATSFLVTCPFFITSTSIIRFIQNHSSWIVKNSAKFIPPKKLTKLKTVSILGKSYEITIKKSARDSMVIFENEQKIYTNTRLLTDTHLRHLFDAKFRPLAKKIVLSELHEFQSQFGFSLKKITVKNQSSLFGSCSSSGNLNFNWQIIFFPTPQFRHILLHELTHLIVKNHSRLFWQTLAKYDPDWHQNRLWLKKEGLRHFLISHK
jgi:predicted metal-dependent hydrolase